MEAPQPIDAVASGMEVPTTQYGRAEISHDPPYSAANFCCPSFLSAVMSIICPFSWLGSCRVLHEKEGAMLLTWGKFSSVITEPGCYVLNPCGTTLSKVTTKQQTTDLPNVKLLDLKGNPVVVSGVVFWQVEGVKASLLNVENVYQYVNTTAMATLKQVVSKYPYEDDEIHIDEATGSHSKGLSLKTEAAQVSRELKDVLQDRLAHAGVRVIAFNMTDLSYAPEIAQAMLVRQQAEAMVKARKLIVKGAVDISNDAVSQLESKGVQMSEGEKTKIVTNLLTVICGDQRAQPTLSVS
eukprot:CAMPEP_0197474604 /NCGR_PEP_ID=MMETSP1309-20131121/6061_1 /TAXON_ID=464262 /ORGANISM="Genus nov. species nov., Strain RCC998" /LENGTH=295 /DNA_ID=CAMNT_0043014317 /DNA_START=221 /DNA_END=1108 /DNA_ORIENTATION=-